MSTLSIIERDETKADCSGAIHLLIRGLRRLANTDEAKHTDVQFAY